MSKSFNATAYWLALMASPALAAPTPQEARTVSWYVDRPAALASVTEICRNDPGHGRTNPDCINADQARVVVAERRAVLVNSADLTPPTNPNYWRIHPTELPPRLSYCDHAPPAAQEALYCPSAYAAAGRGRR